jgi:hypothetical protein
VESDGVNFIVIGDNGEDKAWSEVSVSMMIYLSGTQCVRTGAVVKACFR